MLNKRIIGRFFSNLLSDNASREQNKSCIPQEDNTVIPSMMNMDRKVTEKVTVKNHRVLVTRADKTIKIVIKPKIAAAEVIRITVEGKNLYTGEYDNGYLQDGDKNLLGQNSQNYRTTKWLPILASQGKSLVLSGTAHNRACWQFKTADGDIIPWIGGENKYKTVTDVLQDRTVSRTNIPENAAYARVYFACLEEDVLLDNRMQIEYGNIPTSYQPYHSEEICLPELKKKQKLIFSKGKWTLKSIKKTGEVEKTERNDIAPLNLMAGDSITVNPEECTLKVSWKPASDKVKRSGVYGIRWNMNDSNPVCERVGDAKGITFNAQCKTSYMTPYPNSFDRIYPWSDIKVCNVKITKNGKRKIIYSNEEGFRLDGSAGNVMVEIPRFYCKREQIDGYEYLWISAKEQEGFILDPSFITEQKNLKYIYIGAYLSGIENKRLNSVSEAYPLIRKSMRKIKELEANSKGFLECDLTAILTIQRLFLVETAVLDSQSVFAGYVNLPYLLKDKSTPYYAVKSETATNRIFVKDTGMTQKFCVGDAVSVLGSWKEFKNKPMQYQRDITGIKNLGKGTLEITFSGNPVDITKKETGITCIPCKNGRTDQLSYLTGSTGESNGHSSFKYRGIENLWGNIFIFLDKAYVKNSKLHLTYPDGRTVQISYQLPVQKVQLSLQQFADPANIIVKEMGYDEENPLIMLPCEIGSDASTFSYYCDAWYNSGEEDVSYVLTYGGAWDNKGYAGIFNFRASFVETDSIPCNGARIILR